MKALVLLLLFAGSGSASEINWVFDAPVEPPKKEVTVESPRYEKAYYDTNMQRWVYRQVSGVPAVSPKQQVVSGTNRPTTVLNAGATRTSSQGGVAPNIITLVGTDTPGITNCSPFG